jgi:PLP dependent protein
MASLLIPSQSSIKVNLDVLLCEIGEACKKVRRSLDEVVLIAVSKGHGYEQLRNAYAYGIRDFGESYAQEMHRKMLRAQKDGLNDIRWHYIGAIQSNKINIIKDADVVQSIGSIRHAEELNVKAKKPLLTFLQVNLDGNVKRQGVMPSEVVLTTEKIKALNMLRLIGLMTVLPLVKGISPCVWFSHMADLKKIIIKKDIMKEVLLSMGMSEDFKDAIAYGANYLRIGTKIFGPRI